MKRLAFLSALTIVSCGGEHLVGENESTLKPCGGIAGIACPGGQQCIDVPNDGCDPAKGGADCSGLCQPKDPNQCTDDNQCPKVAAPCVTCPDGSQSCPKSWCEQGTCKVEFPTCGNPSPQCKDDNECVAPAGPCQQCADGSFVCPKAWCEAGVCKTFFPTCPTPAPMCKTDKECPRSLAPCKLCADGSTACPVSWCDNGQCKMTFQSCPVATCGGFAGLPCKDPSQKCIDDPNDSCDPNAGGADCPGICVP
jgi:hypothetical protein